MHQFIWFVSAVVILISSIALADSSKTFITNSATLQLYQKPTLRLANIITPYQLGSPLESEAQQYLQSLLTDKNVTTEIKKTPLKDRYGFNHAYITLHNPCNHNENSPCNSRDLHEIMVQQGYAIIYNTTNAATKDIAKLRKLEDQARQLSRGLWNGHSIIVTSAMALEQQAQQDYRHKFAYVTGKITEIFHGKKQSYINFGSDWKTDFTVAIDQQKQKETIVFLERYQKQLIGSKANIRGWLEHYNGPMIRLTHNHHIEFDKSVDTVQNMHVKN